MGKNENDLSVGKMDWKIEDPMWGNLPTDTKWCGYYISNFFLKKGDSTRLFIKWPGFLEHYFTVMWGMVGMDRVFGTYSLREAIKFVKEAEKRYGSNHTFTIYDEVLHTYVER